MNIIEGLIAFFTIILFVGVVGFLIVWTVKLFTRGGRHEARLNVERVAKDAKQINQNGTVASNILLLVYIFLTIYLLIIILF